MYNLVFWGLGYTGFSNLIHYSEIGNTCIGIDINPVVREQILAGTYKSDLTGWTAEEGQAFFQRNHVYLFTDSTELKNFSDKIHFICVPTEVNGEPNNQTVFEVVDEILNISASYEEINILIESTMSPGTAEKVYHRLLFHKKNRRCRFAVSPRRDWFTKELPSSEITRVIGADSSESLSFFKEAISPVYPKIAVASDYRYAEMCKSVENSIRHVSITLANQLADAFPNMDIREVLALAATKWNIGTYWPSFGPGGYCIPVSSKYLVDSAVENSLPLLREAIRYTQDRPTEIAKQICQRIHGQSVLILGMTYEANIAVDKGAAILEILHILQIHNYQTYLNDPFYSDEELRLRYGGIPFDIDSEDVEWKCFDAVILNVFDHRFELLNPIDVIKKLRDDTVVFDNTGRWSQLVDLPEMVGRYHLIGTPSWFNELKI